MTVRLRVCVPVPHDLVQVVQAEKAATTQSTAHAKALQSRVSASAGRPCRRSVGSTCAVRFCEPVPHDLVQVVQAAKAESTPQSMAQACGCSCASPARYGHT